LKNAARQKANKDREKNAVPTPYRFDFTREMVSRLKNRDEEVQSVTNFLN
jgi:hypothetical protein